MPHYALRAAIFSIVRRAVFRNLNADNIDTPEGLAFMNTALFLAFVAATAALLMLPGQDWAFMLSTALRGRHIAAATIGLTTGYVVLTFVLAAGLGPIVAQAPWALVAVTLAGCSYLIYLGISILRGSRRSAGSAGSAQGSGSPSAHSSPTAHSASALPKAAVSGPGAMSVDALRPWPTLRQGIGVSTLNAKSLVLFVAFLPQFITSSAPLPLWMQLIVLGLTWAGLAAIVYTLIGVTSRKLLASRPGASTVMLRVTGIAMILMGLALAAEQAIKLL